MWNNVRKLSWSGDQVSCVKLAGQTDLDIRSENYGCKLAIKNCNSDVTVILF